VRARSSCGGAIGARAGKSTTSAGDVRRTLDSQVVSRELMRPSEKGKGTGRGRGRGEGDFAAAHKAESSLAIFVCSRDDVEASRCFDRFTLVGSTRKITTHRCRPARRDALRLVIFPSRFLMILRAVVATTACASTRRPARQTTRQRETSLNVPSLSSILAARLEADQEKLGRFW
jgi:hypothetical protein